MPDSNGVNGHAEGGSISVEQRLRQLENAVAELQDTDQLEARVVERVYERVNRMAPVAVAQPAEPPGFFARLPRALLPLSVTTITPPNAVPAAQPDGSSALRRALGLYELLVEIRSIWRMYVDPRYRLTWVGRVVPPVLLVAIFASSFWVPGAFFLGKFVDLVLAFFLFKALHSESRRYRDFFPDKFIGPS